MTKSSHNNSSEKHNISLAVESDFDSVCHILASAFIDDPVLRWFSGHDQIYPSLFRAVIEAQYKHHNHIYINEDKTGAAMWLPEGVSAKSPVHWQFMLLAYKLVQTGGLQSLKRIDYIDKLLMKHHLKQPHFYLHAIGSSQGHQGEGIGSALIKKGLISCDKQKVPAYLESSNERNNALYERFGFKTVREVQLPESGPTIWLMQRPVGGD